MAERCNASGQDQDESCDNGIDRAAFGELRDRCDYVSEPWLTHADIYDEDGAVAVSDERSVTANEAHQAGSIFLRVASSLPTPTWKQTRRALRMGRALVNGQSYGNVRLCRGSTRDGGETPARCRK